MSLFDWKDKYAIGSPEIDREHRALFHMVNELEEAMVSGKAEGGLESLFERLAAYSRFHFRTEEKQMRAQGYPDTEQHVREHNEFIARLALLGKKLSQGEEGTDFETLRFLAHWLEAHVLGADRRLARHLSRVTT
jgi:hemerythrin